MGGKWPTDPTPHPTGDHLMKEVPTHIAPQVSFVSCRSHLSLMGPFCLFDASFVSCRSLLSLLGLICLNAD